MAKSLEVTAGAKHLLPKVRRRTGRKLLAVALVLLSAAMVVAAGWLGAYPFYTNLRADRRQAGLRDAFEQAKATTTKQEYQAGKVAAGGALTRLIITKLGVDIVVVEGTNDRALAAGAGHYRNTPLPGERGNVGIAGHRTMYGKPFNRLDELGPGDEVVLVTPFARHTYRLVPPFDGHANPWVTAPNDWGVVAESAEPMLTLTTCTPKGSARQRLIARGELVSSEPL